MIVQQTLGTLRALKLEGMASAFEEQLTLPTSGQLAFEDLDVRASRGLEAAKIASLAHGEWLERGQTVLIVGPTGVGKTWLACALAQKACRLGKSALYLRLPRLLEELRIARGEGTHKRRLLALAKTELLVLDDLALQPLEAYGREDLLEVIDDRSDRCATIVTAQLPIEHWHAWIGEATIADAILDRLVHHAHRITLKGESLRRSAGRSTIDSAPKSERS